MLWPKGSSCPVIHRWIRNVYQPVSAHQWPIMKTAASTSPPERPAITMALPTESHQIQKYGLAALVRSPARYGFVTAPSGVVSRDAFLLPANRHDAKNNQCDAPDNSDERLIRACHCGQAENDQQEDDSLDNHVPERDFQAGGPVPGKGRLNGSDKCRAGCKCSGKADNKSKDQHREEVVHGIPAFRNR